MRPLTLRPHEARHLARHGRCVVIRAVELCNFRQSADGYEYEESGYTAGGSESVIVAMRCPLGPPGSETWCRETWSTHHKAFYPHYTVVYKADGIPSDWEIEGGKVYSPEAKDWFPFLWRSPATMPRWASRFPRVVHVGTRLCRLSQVTEEEAESHGIEWHKGPLRAGHTNHVSAMRSQWNRDNPRHPAESDPWVWVSTIERKDPTDA